MPATITNIPKLYDKAFDWVLYYGPKILVAILVFIAGEWLIKLLKRRLVSHFDQKRYAPTLRPFLQSLVFTLLQVLLVLLIMQIMGIQLTIFAAVIAAFGAAAGLALSGTLQNFASGILILLLKPFTTGDNIIAQDEEGTVTGIQLFYTTVTTFDNRTVIVPNGKLSNEKIVNITRQGRRRLDIELKFSYAVDIDKVKEVLLKAISEADDILKDPAPRTGISLLEEQGYKFLINIWVNAHGFQDTKLKINEYLLKALKGSELKWPGAQ